MLQKTTWMHYLIIGISTFFISFFLGCEERIEYRLDVDLIFINKTNHSINYYQYDFDRMQRLALVFNLESHSQEKIEIRADGGAENQTINDCCLGILESIQGSSVLLEFNDERHIKYSYEQGPSNLLNFQKRVIANRYYEFTYTFTEEDYNKATPLVFGEGFVGSVWRCTEGAGLQEDLAYSELRFVSKTQVEGWIQREEEAEPELSFTAYYTLKGETLTISEDGDDSFTATLNEDYTGLNTNIDGEGECVFYKQ